MLGLMYWGGKCLPPSQEAPDWVYCVGARSGSWTLTQTRLSEVIYIGARNISHIVWTWTIHVEIKLHCILTMQALKVFILLHWAEATKIPCFYFTAWRSCFPALQGTTPKINTVFAFYLFLVFLLFFLLFLPSKFILPLISMQARKHYFWI